MPLKSGAAPKRRPVRKAKTTLKPRTSPPPAALKTDFSSDDLLLLSRLANFSYQHDAQPAVHALGLEYLTQIGNSGCQALIVKRDRYTIVAFQGTRALQIGFSLPELWDDLNGAIFRLGGGIEVHAGFWLPLADLWPRVAGFLSDGPVILTGHSLGGVRAMLGKALCPMALVVSLGAPKGANGAFWVHHYPDRPPVRLVHERDFAPLWPPEGRWVQPPWPMGWLTRGSLIEAECRPGLCSSVADHSCEQGYIPALSRVASVATPRGVDTRYAEHEAKLCQALTDEYAIAWSGLDPLRIAAPADTTRLTVEVMMRTIRRAGLELRDSDK